MKRGLIWICVLFLLSGCALLPTKARQIDWPEKIQYMEALCELDMAWKDMNYTGSMSLKVDYPEQFQFEVYGPFGDTIVYLKKDRGAFLLLAGDEKFTDEKAFEKKFDIKLSEFVDDITFHSQGDANTAGKTVVRDRYRVTYQLGGNTSRICWQGAEGRICVRFLDARFSKE